MSLSYGGFYQSIAEHNRQATNSWSYSMPDDWDEDEEWEEYEDDEPPRELTPEQTKRINEDLKKILEDGKKRGEEIWKKMNTKNLQMSNYYAWWIF